MAVNILNKLKELAGDERRITEINEILKERNHIGQVTHFATIVPGIKGKKQMAVARNIKHITVKDEGCGGECATPEQEFIEQWWDPRRVKICIKLCYKDLEGSIVQWGLSNGYEVHDLKGTHYQVWFTDFIQEARANDLMGQVLFGHENMEDSILSKPELKKYYNLIDKGLLPTLQYFKTLEAFKGNFIKIDKNDAATLKEQTDLSKGYTMKLFESLEEMSYKVSSKAKLYASRSLFRNYLKDYTNSGPPLESTQKNIQEGVATSRYWGIEVQPVNDYDRIVREDFVSGQGAAAKAYTPHFAMLTDKSNIMIGVDSASALEDLRFEYVGGSDEHFYIKGGYMLDVKIANPLEVVAAF